MDRSLSCQPHVFCSHVPCLSMSCTNPRDKVHFLFWSSSVAQFSNEQRNPRSPHSWPNYALPQPFSYVFNRASPLFFFFLWLAGFLHRFLPVFPPLSHPHTCTRPFTLRLGPNPASHLPVFSPPQNCNEPYSLLSHQNSPCTPGSRKTDLSPLSLQFPLGAPCPTSLMPCWLSPGPACCLCHAVPECRCPGYACPTRPRRPSTSPQPCLPVGPRAQGHLSPPSSICCWAARQDEEPERRKHSSSSPAPLQHTWGLAQVAGFGSFTSHWLKVYVTLFLLLCQSLLFPLEQKGKRETRKDKIQMGLLLRLPMPYKMYSTQPLTKAALSRSTGLWHETQTPSRTIAMVPIDSAHICVLHR